MATKAELKEKLKRLEEGLGAVPQEFVADIEKEIADTQKAIEAMGEEKEEEEKEEPKMENGDDFLKTMLATIQATMAMGEGSGVDSPTVRAMIREYLKDEKVKLDELDKSILEEIKKNQNVILQIPAFGMSIQVSAANARIPNFFDIIDDVLAGNNVYLIGEAGGGKTYTAETVAQTLRREYVTINCSQYTSPLEILGGQSIEGFKQGKLIDAWKSGKILILDEMPKLDANTAGLFNDALAKSSKTRSKDKAKINSANPDEPPIERDNNFACIATGNIYPNTPPAPQYRGNNQQDLSLLDRFSGSVYYTEFDQNTDQDTTRFKFLYDFLIGNYYEYIDAKMKGDPLPEPRGLRTVIDSLQLKNLALVSYRTNVAFRVGFEYELVRAVAKMEGKEVETRGKTFLKTFKSYMVAFGINSDAAKSIIKATKYTDSYIQSVANDAIKEITKDKDGFFNSLNPLVKDTASKIYKEYNDFFVPKVDIVDSK